MPINEIDSSNYGCITLNSHGSTSSSAEGSQINMYGRGGNSGDTLFIDGYEDCLRVASNGNSTGANFCYNFNSTGLYCNNVITNSGNLNSVISFANTTIPISKGGTGATTAASARSALGITPTIKYEEVTTRDGHGTYFNANGNALAIGFAAISILNHQVIISIGGCTKKSGTDWILAAKDGYKPYNYYSASLYFSYYGYNVQDSSGGAQRRGHINSDGVLYLESLGGDDYIFVSLAYNIV